MGERIPRWVKSYVKSSPHIYSLYGAYCRIRDTARIAYGERRYKTLAKRQGLLQSDTEEVQLKLQERLAARGVFPKPLARIPHVLYASGHSPWDIVNIVPGFKTCSDVTLYDAKAQGFDITNASWHQNKERMNRHFVEFVRKVHEHHPVDLVLTYYSGNHVTSQTIEEINNLGIVTAAFHLDDRLLFWGKYEGGSWSGPAPLVRAYDLNLTQAPESLIKYRVEGGLSMLWPLAANPDLCYPRDVPFKYDVSLVGTAYGNRIALVHYLKKHGINVATFGHGWPSGFLPADKFQEIYSASKINLNFDDIGFTHYQCGKIRDFEVPMCGALMLCTHNQHLSDYFAIDKEIFTFLSPSHCALQIKRLLSDERLCASARKAARERALREHTWEQRAKDLLRFIGYMVFEEYGSNIQVGAL